MTSDTAIGQLLVLAKRPVPGRVKTRLCPPYTPADAAALAAASLADTIAAVARTAADRRILALDDAAGSADLGRTAPGVLAMTVIGQRAGTLGHRIAAAFADIPAGATLQIGMDTPQVTPELLGECLHRLRSGRVDAVLGLASDGGWWALGLRANADARLLRVVPMSRPDTGERTLAALRKAGLRVGALPELTDVDTAADARNVAASAPRSRFAAEVRRLAPIFAGPSLDMTGPDLACVR